MHMDGEVIQCNYCKNHLDVTAPRCSDCKVAYYCSRKCQSDDWLPGHSLECIGMKTRREEAESKATALGASRLRQGALAKFRSSQQNQEEIENDEGHLSRLARYKKTAQIVVRPGEIVYLQDGRRYGVGIPADTRLGAYPVTIAGYTTMTGKYSFLQDTNGAVYRRRYVVPDVGRAVLSDSVWWETYNRASKNWEPLPLRTDPETDVEWEIYLP